MKIIFLISLYTAALAYTDVDDSFDFDAMVKNRTEFKKFLYCYIDKGPCTNKFMIIGKGHTREATLNMCADCDDVQKHMYHAFIDALKNEFPEEIPNYIKKFDNSEKHFELVEAEMNKY